MGEAKIDIKVDAQDIDRNQLSALDIAISQLQSLPLVLQLGFKPGGVEACGHAAGLSVFNEGPEFFIQLDIDRSGIHSLIVPQDLQLIQGHRGHRVILRRV